ncbi:hypothetical protein JVT61DRAFT_90 [Boletus reticuloceps]|uniref:F-box domain-containing protein n=1 Tax=Boletus reticuloceps TaxID=495285 RepID=A0A8I2Z134_9AGAM|nr:hypothetical protein JVT61DRAFT_90 [Boletus reticuloceps]
MLPSKRSLTNARPPPYQTQFGEINLTTKRKRDDDFSEDPSSKRRLLAHSLSDDPSTPQNTLVVSQPKRKLEDDSTETLPSKRPRPSSTCTGPSLPHIPTAHVPTSYLPKIVSSIYVLPYECLEQILAYLAPDALRTCSKVSVLFRDIAGPLFLAGLGFKPAGRYWLPVNEKHVECLLVWRRLNTFIPPSNLFFHASNDAHLHALDIYMRTPRAANSPAVFLSCDGKSISTSLIAIVMKSAAVSGCRHISFRSFNTDPINHRVTFPKTVDPPPSRLQAFWADTHLAFAPNIICLTIGVLRSSPLRDLSLLNTGLRPFMWNKLLSLLTLPHLTSLELDCGCPLKTILEFLGRHPSLARLDLSPCGKTTYSSHRYPSINLPSLNFLAGTPRCISALARHLQNADVVRSLEVILTGAPSASPLISQVLRTTQHFKNLSHLKITLQFPEGASQETYEIPDNEKRVCRVTDLEIARDMDSPDSDVSLDSRCGIWLQVFPMARNITLIPGSLLDNEHRLREDFIRHAPPRQPMFLTVSRL